MVQEKFIDIYGLNKFIDECDRQSAGAFRREAVMWLGQVGLDFLDVVQKKIIETGTVDSERLLKSFEKGDKDNIFLLSQQTLELEVGTNVQYANWVNDGHWTTKRGVKQRWVPGYWSGSKFVYDPGAKTGMLLKRKWVEGKHYWEQAEAVYQRMFDESLNKKLDEWIKVFEQRRG